MFEKRRKNKIKHWEQNWYVEEVLVWYQTCVFSTLFLKIIK